MYKTINLALAATGVGQTADASNNSYDDCTAGVLLRYGGRARKTTCIQNNVRQEVCWSDAIIYVLFAITEKPLKK
jgi:hypothetical protein